MVELMHVKVNVGVVTCKAMTLQRGRSVVQVLVVRMDYRSGDL